MSSGGGSGKAYVTIPLIVNTCAGSIQPKKHKTCKSNLAPSIERLSELLINKYMADTFTKTCRLCEEDFEGINDKKYICDSCEERLEDKDVLIDIIQAIVELKEDKCGNSGLNWFDRNFK